MKTIKINQDNIELLLDFISKGGEAFKTFRYYNSRDISSIDNHLVTLILTDDNCTPMAYGHLDQNKGKIWVGVCVIQNYARKGFGKHILNELINCAKEFSVNIISLTVDSDNIAAIN